MSVAIVCMVNQTALKIAEANSSSNDTSFKIETDQQCGLLQTGTGNETKSGSFQVKFCLIEIHVFKYMLTTLSNTLIFFVGTLNLYYMYLHFKF